MNSHFETIAKREGFIREVIHNNCNWYERLLFKYLPKVAIRIMDIEMVTKSGLPDAFGVRYKNKIYWYDSDSVDAKLAALRNEWDRYEPF